MQVKKLDTKQKIKQTAIDILMNSTYSEMTLRDVAAKCNMTAGNIYRYYENKEVLFEDIVGTPCKNLVRLVKVTEFVQKFMKGKPNVTEKNVYKNTRFKTFILKQILHLVCENAGELYILINSSKGSRFEGTKQIIEKMIDDTILKMVGDADKNLAETYAFIIISTVSYLLKRDIFEPDKLSHNLQLFFTKLFESF